MAYSIMEAVSIIFIVLGLLLGILAVVLFYTKNMAEVYDALLNRGYVERIEKRRKAREAKHANNNGAANASAQTFGNQVTPSNVSVEINRSDNNSGQTTFLNSENYGNTGVLDDSVQTDFRIVKKLRYSFSKEVIS